MCSVYLKDSEKVVSISSEHLEPVTPTKSNKVRSLLLPMPPLPLLGSASPSCLARRPPWLSHPFQSPSLSLDPTAQHRGGLMDPCGPSWATYQIPLSPIGLLLSPQVKVILGEDREATGILLSIDGEDGIVRMDLDEQLKILNLRFLGKLLEA